jgi:RNA-directed DNA polymerase
LERAWALVRANRGAAGIDRITLSQIEQYGTERLATSWLRICRRSATDRCRRAGSSSRSPAQKQRPLSIPAVRDRIVQAALKTATEPLFEADFLECSFGFRPRRSAHEALQVLIDEACRGRRWVVETDIASCFEAIPHDRLVAAVGERICDRKLLKLLRALLRAGVMEQGAVRRSVTGTPQGGVVSPLLCNVYLHRLDRVGRTRGCGVLVRYADDLVVMCRSKAEAERALAALTAVLAELGLELKQAKTRIVHLREGGEGLDFLGFHHRWVRARGPRVQHVTFLARWPYARRCSTPAIASVSCLWLTAIDAREPTASGQCFTAHRAVWA